MKNIAERKKAIKEFNSKQCRLVQIAKSKKNNGNTLEVLGIAMQVAMLQRQKEKIAAS